MKMIVTQGDADISDCGTYRYSLLRLWGAMGGTVLYVMLNPSTADADQDDPTIRSCIRIAKSHGYGSLEVVNLFAYRATNPRELLRASDPVGPENEVAIERAARRCDTVICAWGAHKMAAAQGRRYSQILRRWHPVLRCLGVTKDGAPRHPLYVRTDAQLQEFITS